MMLSRRMSLFRRRNLAAAAVLVLVAALPARAQTLTWDFHAGQDGWEGGFSDYSMESDFQFEFVRARLPRPLDTTRYGLMIKGMNRSDDMFMFLRRKLEGLVPGAEYSATFKVVFASNAAVDQVGIGGSPGTSVMLKAGITAVKPVDNQGRMNVDKGNQAAPGPDADTLGHIGTPAGTRGYSSLERSNGGRPFTFTAAADGSAWILVGTDSGFEGLTALYYQRVEIALTRRGGTGLGHGHGPDPRASPAGKAAPGPRPSFRADGRFLAAGPGGHPAALARNP